MRYPAFAPMAGAILSLGLSAVAAEAQTDFDPYAIPYEAPPKWQEAAVAALNRALPTDSGYWVLGPLDLSTDLPNSTDLVRTTLRILAPDAPSSRNLTRRLWVPSGGVALEELQPADTLPHALPQGYPGRFLKGTLAGEPVLVQVFTVQAHRWLLWAQRVQVDRIRGRVRGPAARYSLAVARYLAAGDSGRAEPPPSAAEFGLEPIFEFYAPMPAPVLRDREGYQGLLEANRAFSMGDAVRDVYGFVPAPALMEQLEELAERVLFRNREGEVALQHRYREFQRAGGSWSGRPLLSGATISQLEPGLYEYVVDRYGFLRVGPKAGAGAATSQAAFLAHGDAVRAAGELVLDRGPGGEMRVRELNVNSETYFFSNLSLSLYADVEERSDRYLAAIGHALAALERGRLPRDGILIRKF